MTNVKNLYTELSSLRRHLEKVCFANSGHLITVGDSPCDSCASLCVYIVSFPVHFKV